MASRRLELKEEVTLRVLRLVGNNPRISQRNLAEEVGISVGAVHYCLVALAEKGLVKVSNFSASKNKRAYVYLLTPSGMAAKAALTAAFLNRKLAEYEAIKSEIEVLNSELGNEIGAKRRST